MSSLPPQSAELPAPVLAPQATKRFFLPAAVWQTGFLFGLDGLANVIDYGFHIYLAWVLVPGDFAILQTVNASLLVLITTFSVTQPVVARYVAEAAVKNSASATAESSIFRYYFGRSLIVGLLLALLVWLGAGPLAGWLNVPTAVVRWGALMLVIITVRPVVAGMLQGRHQFVAYGLMRLIYAGGRLALAFVLISLGRGLLGAVAAMPLGALLALLAGLVSLGWFVWRPGPLLSAEFRQAGPYLVSAFIAYAAYMSLLNNDLIWVNRLFSADVAANYATAVVLRRVLSLLPGVIIVIMYPRAVAKVTQGKLPDKLLGKTAVVVFAPTLLLALAYALFGADIVRWTFGSTYANSAPLLGWMGLAMLGYGLTAIWLNFYLATRPGPFVALLAITAVTQATLLSRYHTNLNQIIITFVLSGWFLAITGLLVYLFWLRPILSQKVGDHERRIGH